MYVFTKKKTQDITCKKKNTLIYTSLFGAFCSKYTRMIEKRKEEEKRRYEGGTERIFELR